MSPTRTFTVTFDDCFEHTVKNVLPVLDKLDVRATFYAIPNLVGGEMDGMQLADWDLLADVVNRGHEIGSHTMNHTPLPTTMTAQVYRFLSTVRETGVSVSFFKRTLSYGADYALDAVIEDKTNGGFDTSIELEESRQFLEERLGTEVTSFAYPGSVYSRRAVELVKASGYTSARGTIPGTNSLGTNRYRLRSYPGETFADIDELEPRFDSESSEWWIYNFHSVARKPKADYPYTISVADLKSFLQHIDKYQNVEFQPVTDVVNR